MLIVARALGQARRRSRHQARTSWSRAEGEGDCHAHPHGHQQPPNYELARSYSLFFIHKCPTYRPPRSVSTPCWHAPAKLYGWLHRRAAAPRAGRLDAAAQRLDGAEHVGQHARAALDVALLRGVVDVHDAKALGVAVRPLIVVCAARGAASERCQPLRRACTHRWQTGGAVLLSVCRRFQQSRPVHE